MNIEIARIYKGPHYTVGRLFVDGKYLCDTLENPVRNPETPGGDFVKVPGQTAIPYGWYDVSIDITSPRFAGNPVYASIGARMPRLLNVPHFEGVLIHPGNTVDDTRGCILVGHNTAKGRLSQSRQTFFRLYELMRKARSKQQKITLTIVGQHSHFFNTLNPPSNDENSDGRRR